MASSSPAKKKIHHCILVTPSVNFLKTRVDLREERISLLVKHHILHSHGNWGAVHQDMRHQVHRGPRCDSMLKVQIVHPTSDLASLIVFVNNEET